MLLTNGLHQATQRNEFLTVGAPNGSNEKKLNTGIMAVDEEARDTTVNKTTSNFERGKSKMQVNAASRSNEGKVLVILM